MANFEDYAKEYLYEDLEKLSKKQLISLFLELNDAFCRKNKRCSELEAEVEKYKDSERSLELLFDLYG